ncbi:hypothetical protein D8674_008592 [Pyrus ussuriensis x Pyrus communis]|uniref:Uncharacterized protein n=1 Tax=Pyrus ussuriensis x Pyrus communis TaxID=2448454 RepID=A0A5N5HW84_9ROSA|nr:hypothetical protein D8674_008592 [Pyrus ussuriensis x Pyrus communis]
MGKIFGQLFDACLIKWNTFYLDHFGRKWFALEFIDEDNLKYVLNNRPCYDEPIVYPEDVVVNEDIKACLQDDVMLCFPKATNVGGPDEEGWTTVIPKWRMRGEKRISGESSNEGRSYKEVASSPKTRWTPKADLVHDWRRAGKVKERDRQVNANCLDYRDIASDDFLFYVKLSTSGFYLTTLFSIILLI